MMVLAFVLSQCFNIKLISRATNQTCKVVRDTSQSREHSKMDRHFFRGLGLGNFQKKVVEQQNLLENTRWKGKNGEQNLQDVDFQCN